METPTQKHSVRLCILDSLGELRCAGAVIMLMMLAAGAVLLGRHLLLTVSDDMHISFSFVCIMAAGVLFGSVPCMLTAAAADVGTYMLENGETVGYSPALLSLKLIIALFYGVILYKKHYGSFGCPKCLNDCFPECVVLNINIAVRSVIAHTIVVFLGNIVLGSVILYRSYSNSSFPFVSAEEWDRFFEWLEPHYERNIEMLPFGLAMVFLSIPLINIFFTLAGRGYRHICGKNAEEGEA